MKKLFTSIVIFILMSTLSYAQVMVFPNQTIIANDAFIKKSALYLPTGAMLPSIIPNQNKILYITEIHVKETNLGTANCQVQIWADGLAMWVIDVGPGSNNGSLSLRVPLKIESTFVVSSNCPDGTGDTLNTLTGAGNVMIVGYEIDQ